MKKLRNTLIWGLVVFALLIGLAAQSTGAADHLDAPMVQDDGRVDINDLYAFQSPSNSDNVVFIMTVNPGAGLLSPETFRPQVAYEFQFDENGDGRTDSQYEVRFGNVESDGSQGIRLRQRDLGKGGFTTVATGSTGETISVAGGGMLTAGLYDDPFFFDLVAFQDQVQGAGGDRTFCDGQENDFFAGLNVSAIVLEVPRSNFESDNLGVWARTRVGGPQFDRMGRPAINTVLIPSGQKDAYNQTAPVRDEARWQSTFTDTLLALSSLDGSPYSQAEAEGIAAVLAPDILTLDTSSTAGFVSGPLNGRQLADDVIDIELFIVTGGFFGGSAVLDSDCVDSNDKAFSNNFPYLAPPH